MKNKKKFKKPFVFLSTAMSLDGKLSNYKKEQIEVAGNDDKKMREEHRIIADAVMVGGNTLIQDDPALKVKTKQGQKKRIQLGKLPQPVKVGVISNADKLKIRGDFLGKGNVQKIIFTTKQTSKKKIKEISKKAKIYVIGKDKVNLKKAMEILYGLGIKKLMVEGGGELIFSLIQGGLVDEINLKIGNLIVGGRNSITFAEGRGFDELGAKKTKFVSVIKKPNYFILKAKIIN